MDLLFQAAVCSFEITDTVVFDFMKITEVKQISSSILYVFCLILCRDSKCQLVDSRPGVITCQNVMIILQLLCLKYVINYITITFIFQCNNYITITLPK